MRVAKCRVCLAEFDFRYSQKTFPTANVRTKPIGGLRRSPPNYYRAPPFLGERRKRWTC
jgi:hypothetical protein